MIFLFKKFFKIYPPQKFLYKYVKFLIKFRIILIGINRFDLI